jgi:hypothetical protein
MTGYLVPALRNRPHQVGKTFGDPPQHKERYLHSLFVEQIEQSMGIVLDPWRKVIPSRGIDLSREGGDMKVVLDIHRHGVTHGVVFSPRFLQDSS